MSRRPVSKPLWASPLPHAGHDLFGGFHGFLRARLCPKWLTFKGIRMPCSEAGQALWGVKMQAHETSRCAATRDGFDRHDILPTRPRGQTPRGDAPSSTRVQSEATHRARNHEARYIPPSLIS